MRRALAIVKYVPAVLCGLLVAAWVVSWWGCFRYSWPYSSPRAIDAGVLVLHESIVSFRYDPWEEHGTSLPDRKAEYHCSWHVNSPSAEAVLGSMGVARDPLWGGLYSVDAWFPIPALISVLLPVAIGCFNRFRFPLWSYFAYTALVAAELAYYLR